VQWARNLGQSLRQRQDHVAVAPGGCAQTGGGRPISITADLADREAVSRWLVSAWRGEDPNMTMVAEVIASAFTSGLS